MSRFWLLTLIALVAPSTPALTAAEPLIVEGTVDAPVAEVWSAFTTKKGMEAWMVAHAKIDLIVGGLMQTHYDKKGTLGDKNTIHNTILCFDPPRMIAIKVAKFPEKFPFPNAVQHMWTVVYFDEAGPGKTRVRVVGHGFKDDEESKKMHEFFKAGNDYTVKQLQKYFEKQRGQR